VRAVAASTERARGVLVIFWLDVSETALVDLVGRRRIYRRLVHWSRQD